MDLEKAFDRITKEVSWALHMLGVEEWLVSAVMSVHGCKTMSEQFMVIAKVLR